MGANISNITPDELSFTLEPLIELGLFPNIADSKRQSLETSTIHFFKDNINVINNINKGLTNAFIQFFKDVQGGLRGLLYPDRLLTNNELGEYTTSYMFEKYVFDYRVILETDVGNTEVWTSNKTLVDGILNGEPIDTLLEKLTIYTAVITELVMNKKDSEINQAAKEIKESQESQGSQSAGGPNFPQLQDDIKLDTIKDSNLPTQIWDFIKNPKKCI